MHDAFREHCLRGPRLGPLGSQVGPLWCGPGALQARPLTRELPTAPVAGGTPPLGAAPAVLREAVSTPGGLCGRGRPVLGGAPAPCCRIQLVPGLLGGLLLRFARELVFLNISLLP